MLMLYVKIQVENVSAFMFICLKCVEKEMNVRNKWSYKGLCTYVYVYIFMYSSICVYNTLGHMLDHKWRY